MAIVSIPNENKTFRSRDEITRCLAGIGIEYEQWQPREASNEEILTAYAAEIDRLKMSGGYVTADMINVSPDTKGLDEMLAKFNREHRHDEDEVRFIIDGRGLFHIHPP